MSKHLTRQCHLNPPLEMPMLVFLEYSISLGQRRDALQTAVDIAIFIQLAPPFWMTAITMLKRLHAKPFLMLLTCSRVNTLSITRAILERDQCLFRHREKSLGRSSSVQRTNSPSSDCAWTSMIDESRYCSWCCSAASLQILALRLLCGLALQLAGRLTPRVPIPHF